MRELEQALKAAADPTRTRILKLLERRGLCVCQVQATLALAPSTISRHLAILRSAGLVEDRRAGKWVEYRLTEDDGHPHARAVLALLRDALARDERILADRRRLREVLAIPMDRLCALPAARVPRPARVAVTRRRNERIHG